jgi:phosphate transport system permease protein
MNSAARNRFKDKAFMYFGIACTLFGLVMLVIFLGNIVYDGVTRIDWDFLTNFQSRKSEKSGIYAAWAGTAWVLGLTALISIPLGVSAAIYLEEYGQKSKMAKFIEINIANLAGVPSIIYGLLGLEIFARAMHLGGSLLTGALTLSLLVLPIIVVATREALKAVPSTIRQASYGMGATKWQTIWMQILPASAGGIVTGVILALSRAIGETAPLIVIGALAYVRFVPTSPMDEFTVMPLQIFNWISRPQEGFHIAAAGAIIVLLLITFAMNGIAVYLRYRWQKRVNY